MIPNSLIYSQLTHLFPTTPHLFWSGKTSLHHRSTSLWGTLEVGSAKWQPKTPMAQTGKTFEHSITTPPEIQHIPTIILIFERKKTCFCFKATLFSVWFGVLNVHKFPWCISGWIRLVHHWNQAVWCCLVDFSTQTPKTNGFSVMTLRWNSPSKERYWPGCVAWNHFQSSGQ